MSSKSTLGQIQGTSAMTRKVKSTIVENRKAILVQIGWTTAPVIKTTVRRNFRMSVLAMDTRTWTPIQRSMMTLKAGQVIHYTQSSEHPGYYYITIVNESCTCVAGLYKQECHHQTDAVAFEVVRTMEAAAKISQEYEEKIAPIVAAHMAAMIDRDAEQAEVVMPNGTRRMASQVNDACLNSLDAMVASYAVADAKWQEMSLAEREAYLNQRQARQELQALNLVA